MSEVARLELSRDRNKEHARATRKRKRIFETVLTQRIKSIQTTVFKIVGTRQCSRTIRENLIMNFFEVTVCKYDRDVRTQTLG